MSGFPHNFCYPALNSFQVANAVVVPSNRWTDIPAAHTAEKRAVSTVLWSMKPFEERSLGLLGAIESGSDTATPFPTLGHEAPSSAASLNHTDFFWPLYAIANCCPSPATTGLPRLAPV